MSVLLRGTRVFAAGALVACFAGIACSKESEKPAASGPSADELPETVAVSASELVAGLAKGSLRVNLQVEAFRISKHPITVGQYRACVDKGACTKPASTAPACEQATGPTPLDGPTFEQGDAALPLTCATAQQAAAFCAWVGGRLPGAAEWMLAARGPKVSRYAWGDHASSCGRHPEILEEAAGARCSSPASFSIGTHQSGASPNGVEDVLLGRGELIRAEADAPVNACTAPHVACVAYGAGAGAIDGFEAVATDSETRELSTKAATFRCTFGESA